MLTTISGNSEDEAFRPGTAAERGPGGGGPAGLLSLHSPNLCQVQHQQGGWASLVKSFSLEHELKKTFNTICGWPPVTGCKNTWSVALVDPQFGTRQTHLSRSHACHAPRMP